MVDVVSFLPMLGLGFALGLAHALDADHIMAVSTLSSTKPGLRRSLFYSANWAVGHSGVLLLCGILLFGLGVSLPETLSSAAEAAVGITLVVLGLMLFWQSRNNRLKLAVHRHGDIVHTHWHDDSQEHAKEGVHKPMFVGMLHGLAGSAPALALIPAVAYGNTTLAIAYLLLFSLGVLLSMMAFGLGFSHVQRFLSQRYESVFALSRQFIAFVSIALGSFWFYQAV